ncbi:MAG TPA: glycosyl hydrolase [Terriglobales bacterium]|nr:glycosyl hydrolase [Terriglobales bacterium]
MPASVATLLTIVVAAALVTGFLFLSGRAYLLPGLPASPTPAAALSGTVGRSPAGTYWGAFLPGADQDQSIVSKFTSDVGRQPAIVSMYQQWAGEPSFPTTFARWLADRGTVPLVAWEPWQPGGVVQPAYRLSVIAAGGLDSYVRRYADQVRAYAGPLFLETLHEMNGNWYPWGGTVNGNTPADYVAAWRHLHDVFRQEGATNVTWTWTPNGETVPDTAANQPERYWPGAQYVDWVGVDSYNWGASAHTQWRTFAEMFDANVTALSTFGKPIILAETASVERGGDKAAWITALFQTLTGADRDAVSGVIWFDKAIPGFDWHTNTSAASQAAFNAGVARPGMLSARQLRFSSKSG